MIKIWGRNTSSNVQKAMWAVGELKLEHTRIDVGGAFGKNKEAAYLLCQWMVSKQQGARLLQAGGGVPFRNSILNDPEIQKGVKMPKEWLQSVIDSAKISKLGLPVVIPVAEFRDIVGAALTATLSGADPATELKKANDQFRPILERSEKA